MHKWLVIFLLMSVAAFAQRKPLRGVASGDLQKIQSTKTTSSQKTDISVIQNDSVKGIKTQKPDSIPPIDKYLIRDYQDYITAFDTTLTIKKHYAVNYLRKDDFGLLSLANDGQSYNTLDFGIGQYQAYPTIGFGARQFAYQAAEDVNYYHVPTPTSELYYRSAIKQGQTLDALFTTNLHRRLNVFVGYKGIRSNGAYINQLTSNGNFKIGGSYFSENNRYNLKTHIAVQDISSQENGGITDPTLYYNNDGEYGNRERLNVFFRDATSLYKGFRGYLQHRYDFVQTSNNALAIKHIFKYEYLTNAFSQDDTNPVNYFTELDGTQPQSNLIENYYGQSFASNVYDKVRNRNFYNQLALSFDHQKWGELSFGLEHFNYNYYYSSQVLSQNGSVLVPDALQDDVVSVVGKYQLRNSRIDADFSARQSIVGNTLSELSGLFAYQPTDNIQVLAKYDFISKQARLTQQLFQSNYVGYNWYNQFDNEKINRLQAQVQTPWVNIGADYQLLHDKVFFALDNPTVDSQGRIRELTVAPMQYSSAINYLGLRLQKEFKLGKFALDNTVLYQTVEQADKVLNLPELTTRNTLYYSDYWFDKALFLQTGITFQYFTAYYADGYLPVVGDFYTQTQTKIGNYPVLDFFFNAKIRTARVFFKVENFNEPFQQKNKQLAAPNYPHRDMTIRIGVIWDFFS